MAGDTVTASRPLASFEGLDLAVPECARGLGSVILSPDSADLIEGVRAEPFPIYPDDRGYFLEVQRLGGGLTQNFPPESIQVSAAEHDSGLCARNLPAVGHHRRPGWGLPVHERT